MAIPRAFASLCLALLLVASPLCCMGKQYILSGDSLRTGDSLVFAAYSFIMQADCNLVLYDNGNPIWASNTGGLGRNCRCDLQRDGNLVVYTTNNRPLWASNTNRPGNGNYVLLLQRDRNVVIYGSSLWATNTNQDSLTGGMYIESKATIFADLAANKTTTEAYKAEQNIAMVINK